MSNLIVRAEHEVFIATNFWMHSEPSSLIANAIRELSKRSVAAGRTVVIKVLYDRGDLAQVIKNHQHVSASAYSAENGPIRLPKPEDVPNVEMEVVNYHRPVLGTFHAKFMIVDRRIAIVQSDNIQDNDNLEMAAQYEGAIVDSIYDTAIVTWNDALQPPLPRLTSPAAGSPTPTFELGKHGFLFDKDGSLVKAYQ